MSVAEDIRLSKYLHLGLVQVDPPVLRNTSTGVAARLFFDVSSRARSQNAVMLQYA
jgi:hypothetical protein